METRNKIKTIINIIIIIIVLLILFVNSVILIKSFIKKDEVPDFMGYKPFIVLSGSMESQINSGDLVVVKETDVSNLKVGDIIAIKKDNIVFIHRITKIIEENKEIKYITKGDNNNTEDYSPVLQSEIEGKFQFKISRLGNVAIFMQTPTGMITILSIPILILIIINISNLKKERQELESSKVEMEQELTKLKKKNEELLKK